MCGRESFLSALSLGADGLLRLGVNILSHFMLDLREMAQAENVKSMTGTSTVAQTLSFVTFHSDLPSGGKDTDQERRSLDIGVV